jgi:hypothetical protein
MSKVMFITVGTSLFESVTWEPRDQLPQSVPYYESHWLRDPKKLRSPEARCGGARDRKVRSGLEAALDGTNGTEWAKHLPEDLLRGEPNPTTFLRYSAELTTVLKLYEAEGEGNLGEWLRTYDRVQLMVDRVSSEAGTNLPLIAASQLAAYLNAITGEQTARLWPVNGISSIRAEELKAGLQELIRGLGAFLQEHKSDRIDFVISGGYKVYGIFLAPLALLKNRDIRVIYIHETGDDLVVASRSTIAVGGEQPEEAVENDLWEELSEGVGLYMENHG